MGLLSEFLSPRWAADQGQQAPPARRKRGYIASGKRSRPLILVGIQGVPHGGQRRNQGLCHSTDGLGIAWSSPMPTSSDYVDRIYPKYIII